VDNEKPKDTLEESLFFATSLYTIKKLDFLDVMREISERHIACNRTDKAKKPYVTMSDNYSQDPDANFFTSYVSQTAWNILNSQGYAMKNKSTYLMEMWTQEHNQHSSMDIHVHNRGAIISCFYFLHVPEGGCQIVLHDPRPTKLMIDFEVADDSKITAGTERVYINASDGMLVFANAWLPHSFTRNISDKPTSFIHMNFTVIETPTDPIEVEVV
jgi:uncharacterized protein (TIGR02466 family)